MYLSHCGKTVKILAKDDSISMYTNALVNAEKEGWLDIYRLPEFEGGRATSIAGWWLREIKMWEYVGDSWW